MINRLTNELASRFFCMTYDLLRVAVMTYSSVGTPGGDIPQGMSTPLGIPSLILNHVGE